SQNNLHVVSYSIPVNKEVSYEELCEHIHTDDQSPDAIPYITSYYKETWGFCLARNTFDSLPRRGTYKVFIDSTLEDGSMTYGDLVLPGDTEQEILLSTYICHPSMANNELSGPLVTAFLYRAIAAIPKRRYSYRFVFGPETIGAIAYLATHGESMLQRVLGGYVVHCIGNDAPFTYKRSRQGNSMTDRITEYVFERRGYSPDQIIEFFPGGSDERQYCSPGFDLPIGSVMRSMYRTYPEYHTSLDDKSFISFAAMAKSVELYLELVGVFEANRRFKNRNPYCEPQLGSRGLYSIVGAIEKPLHVKAILWVLNQADGSNDLLQISERSGIDFDVISEASRRLEEKELLEALDSPPLLASQHKPIDIIQT
ncbi:unnamed protein product, partial [marine sediment metagenome]